MENKKEITLKDIEDMMSDLLKIDKTEDFVVVTSIGGVGMAIKFILNLS